MNKFFPRVLIAGDRPDLGAGADRGAERPDEHRSGGHERADKRDGLGVRPDVGLHRFRGGRQQPPDRGRSRFFSSGAGTGPRRGALRHHCQRIEEGG